MKLNTNKEQINLPNEIWTMKAAAKALNICWSAIVTYRMYNPIGTKIEGKFIVFTREDINILRKYFKKTKNKKHIRKKFTAEQIKYIRKSNKKPIELAKELETSMSTISLIRNYRTHKEIEND